MPMKGHPPEPVDFGAMTDNCGNCVVWMRPAVLDDIGNDVAEDDVESALAMLATIKARFDREAAKITYEQTSSERVDIPIGQ